MTRHLPQIIQYLDRTSPSVSFTPLCCTLWCTACTIRDDRSCRLSSRIGCRTIIMSAFCSRPPHLHSWSSSLKRPNCTFQVGKFTSEFNNACLWNLSQGGSCALNFIRPEPVRPMLSQLASGQLSGHQPPRRKVCWVFLARAMVPFLY